MRARAVAGGVLVAALVVLTPSAAFAVPRDFTPPGGPSEVRLVSDLPVCPNNVDGIPFADEKNAMGLGWSGQWNVGFLASSSRFWQVSNSVICQQSGKLSGAILGVQLTGAIAAPAGTDFAVRALARCITSDGIEFTVEAPRTHTLFGGGGALNNPSWRAFLPSFGNDPVHGACTRVISVAQFLEFWASSGPPVRFGLPIVSTWRAQDWRNGVSSWKQAVDPSDVQGDGFELPITCDLNASGDDIFEVMQNWLGSLAAWPGCMLIPAGWDRAGLIGSAWDLSPGARLADALSDTMPSGLACGEMAVLEFYGQSVSLDSCDVTFVPSAVKVGLTAFVILACAFAIWRRLTWAVGSG